MSGTTSVPSPTFGSAGFIAPAEKDVLNGALTDINAAFGGGLNTTNLGAPQGQLASSLTAIIADKNDKFLAITQGVDPFFADGRMQDGIARIYFITRYPAQATVVTCLCTGTANVAIPTRALARASDGNLYTCIAGGTIGTDGTVALQFACTTTGPIPCPAASLTEIYRGVPLWDSITNPADGVVGNNTETRAQFELRRQQSVYLNSVGSIAAVQAAVLNVSGILDAYTTDNSTGVPVVMDGITLPANSLYVCVSGGDPTAVARAIWTKKLPGCRTIGSTTITVQDTNSGYSPPYPAYNINFQIASPQSFVIRVSITNAPSVPSTAPALIQAVILSAFAGLDGGPRARIASQLYASRFYSGVAQLGNWAEIISIKLGSTGAPKAVFQASISGNVMSVSAISSGVIGIGQTLIGLGIADNVTITSLGTGSGGTGTYNISLPQSIATEQITSIFPDQDTAAVGIAHIPVLSAANIQVVLV